MTDIASSARTARESLARGLSALQSDPNIPPPLLELAGTIAQAMGALHQIERSNGAALVPHAHTALNNVRTALSQLQSAPAHNPSVAQAMEAVAGALGMVHALAKLAPAPGGPQPAQPSFPQAAPQPSPQPLQQAWQQPPQQQAPQQQWQQPTQPQAANPYGPPPQQQYAPPPQQASPYGPPPQQQADPFAAPNRSPMAATALAPSAPAQPGHSKAPPAPAAPPGDVPVIAADLGAHSPTNFYKGLSGNDVIDHGGLFVSTYMIPKLGQTIRLRVSLPGGYEFEANAVVRWRREQGGDAPPGFGAQFSAITPEARQLVQRYVRNREPLFYDEL